MRRAVLLLTALSTVLAGVLAAPPATAAPPDDDCPTAVPAAAIVPGLRGTGFTVVSGTRETFSVEVLGVLDDAVAPGRDVVVVSLAGPVIDRAGGAWSGMSGSPVFVGDRLLGAVAYLLAGGAPVAALTPGADVLALFDDPAVTVAPTRVPLDARTAQAVAELTGRPAAQVAQAGLTAVPLPLAVSGFSPRRMDQLRAAVADRGLSLVPYASASASLGPLAADGEALRPGEDLAAVLSYGDVTWAATGVVTARCGDRLVGFGHPMLHGGDTTLGAATGTSLALVADPVWGSFELVAIGDVVGTIDQDRFAGVRVDTTVLPRAVPVTSTVRDVDRSRSRSGRTDAIKTDWVADLTFAHVLSSIDTVIDRVPASGSSEVDVVVRGVDGTGAPFTYRRSNVFATTYDVAFESVAEVYGDLALLTSPALAAAEITGVDVRAGVRQEVRRYTIAGVEYATDGGTFLPLDGLGELPLPAGGVLTVRVTLDPGGRGAPVIAEAQLAVPDTPGPASLEIRGGPGGPLDPWLCIYEPQTCVGDAGLGDLQQLVELLAGRSRNDDLVVSLVSFDEGVLPPEGEGAAGIGAANGGAPSLQQPVTETRVRQDRVVTGFLGVPAYVAPSGVGGVEVGRLAGTDRVETALAVSREAFPEPGLTSTVVLARADDPADALAGAPLATSLGAPLLLTWGDRLTDTVAEEVLRLGATEVVVLGGVGAVSDAVVASLEALGVATVSRIAGADRFATAGLVAERVGGDRVLLARGDGAGVDAVAASALAALQGTPLLLTGPGPLPAATLAALNDLGATAVRVVGGTAAVPVEVEEALVAQGLVVERVAGRDRYATSAALARLAVAEGADPTQVVVATGRTTPDALVAGALAGWWGGVLLLVDGHDPAGSLAAQEVLAELGASSMSLRLTVVGGTGAIAEEVVADLLGAARSTSADVPG